jgi:FkbM family methyltransferase
MSFPLNAYIQRFLKKFGRRIERVRDPFADIQRLLAPFNVNAIIDGGAYHGLISKQLLSLLPNAIVYAFEPQKESFAVLEYNVRDIPNIKPMNLALSSASGRKELHVTEKPYSSSLFPRGIFGEKYYPEATRPHGIHMVDVVTLDEWVGGAGISCIDIIKLDLRGHELDALMGGLSY